MKSIGQLTTTITANDAPNSICRHSIPRISHVNAQVFGQIKRHEWQNHRTSPIDQVGQSKEPDIPIEPFEGVVIKIYQPHRKELMQN